MKFTLLHPGCVVHRVCLYYEGVGHPTNNVQHECASTLATHKIFPRKEKGEPNTKKGNGCFGEKGIWPLRRRGSRTERAGGHICYRGFLFFGCEQHRVTRLLLVVLSFCYFIVFLAVDGHGISRFTLSDGR